MPHSQPLLVTSAFTVHCLLYKPNHWLCRLHTDLFVVFIPYDARSAKRGIAIVSRPSVRLSVRRPWRWCNDGHISWVSSKLITRIITLLSSLLLHSPWSITTSLHLDVPVLRISINTFSNPVFSVILQGHSLWCAFLINALYSSVNITSEFRHFSLKCSRSEKNRLLMIANNTENWTSAWSS